MQLALVGKLVGALLLSACFAWMIFAVSIHRDDDEGIPGTQPGNPLVRQSRRLPRSPAPVVKPAGRPAFMDWLGDEFNLRQCQCRRDWQTQPAGSSVCRCRGNCPKHVTPAFLTEAKGQALCSLEEDTGFNCYAECENEKAAVKWFALPCGNDKQEPCEERILAKRKASRDAEEQKKRDAEAERKRKEEEEAKAAAARPSELPKLTWDPKDVYDLRGLGCEEKDGKTQCYMEDEQGRELCPSYVTPEWLTAAANQYLCGPEMAQQFFCTVGCQDGQESVRWGAHEAAWCYDPKNAGSCPERPKVYPRADFKLQPWSAVPEPELPCERAWRDGERPKPIKGLTVGLLTHEPNSFSDSMKTYEANGFFDVIEEFLIYINKRRPEVEAVAETYRAKYPDRIKVMGDADNHGILKGMMWLTGNATNPYFLFMERDFQLIEPATCVVEQLQTGMDMVKDGTAHVMRYRHRRHPGRPNWAARMFRGHEEDVFKGGQPNLFCNHYYWVNEPHKKWPDKIWHCHKDGQPEMFCSDSYYCNWTNNPQLWSVEWWNKEYVQHFDNFKRNDPYYDIEVYMNWEPNSWNDRKWIVGQGDGLFKHMDRGKYGF